MYDRIPPACRDALIRHVLFGDEVGGFVTAVLENNLVEAFARADEHNTHFMRVYADWLYNVCPMAARGDAVRVREWKGLAPLGNDWRHINWRSPLWAEEARQEWERRQPPSGQPT